MPTLGTALGAGCCVGFVCKIHTTKNYCCSNIFRAFCRDIFIYFFYVSRGLNNVVVSFYFSSEREHKQQQEKMYGGAGYRPLSKIVFEKHDKDGSGSIDANELKGACYDMGHFLSEEEIAAALHKLDTNGDGVICYNEFREWWKTEDRFEKLQLDEGVQTLIQNCVTYFRYFDKDNSGHICSEEFRSLHKDLIKNGYGSHLKDEDEDLKALDKNGDGNVDFNEYISWLVSIGTIALPAEEQQESFKYA